MSDVQQRYTRVADGFGDRLGAIRAEQWNAPTPCAEWDVRALAAHVINTHGRVLAPVAGQAPPPVDENGDLAAQWALARQAIIDALTDPASAATVVSGTFREQSFEQLVGTLLCADTLLHTWDLARATGQDERLDGEAVRQAQAFLEPIDDAIRRPGGFGPKIAPAPEADAQTRLLNFGGREVG